MQTIKIEKKASEEQDEKGANEMGKVKAKKCTGNNNGTVNDKKRKSERDMHRLASRVQCLPFKC